MLYSSPTSLLCPAGFFCAFKNILLYLILLCSVKRDSMWTMVGTLKDCNHVEISFLHMVKIFLKSFLLPSLIFLLFPYSTTFPWDLATHVGFWQKKTAVTHQENCLFALRSTLRILWAAHGALWSWEIYFFQMFSPQPPFCNVPLHYVA